MKTGIRRGPRGFRPLAERMEQRLVLSGAPTVLSEIKAILSTSVGGAPIRPNSPVDPIESPYAAASFIDPGAHVIQGKRTRLGQKDYIAPGATLDASHGFIKIRSSSSIQDNATLTANPSDAPGVNGIFIGDDVVVGTGAKIIGPSAIGGTAKAGKTVAAVTIGANATIDDAIIEPGAYVGALATIDPGVTVPTGFRVLPGMLVTTDAEADTPSLGKVVAVTSADTSAATAKSLIADNTALASGYSEVYQGNSAVGGSATAGPVPKVLTTEGTTIFLGALKHRPGGEQ